LIIFAGFDISKSMNEFYGGHGMKLREKFWLWGQSPDAHWENDNTYKLPGHSRMTAVEGCYYFGISNICRVKMMNHPKPPYDQESEAMRPCDKVVWSLLGAGGEPVTDWGDLDEVIRQAKMYDKIPWASKGQTVAIFLHLRRGSFPASRPTKSRLATTA
jgi:hypothetical protein